MNLIPIEFFSNEFHACIPEVGVKLVNLPLGANKKLEPLHCLEPCLRKLDQHFLNITRERAFKELFEYSRIYSIV